MRVSFLCSPLHADNQRIVAEARGFLNERGLTFHEVVAQSPGDCDALVFLTGGTESLAAPLISAGGPATPATASRPFPAAP